MVRISKNSQNFHIFAKIKKTKKFIFVELIQKIVCYTFHNFLNEQKYLKFKILSSNFDVELYSMLGLVKLIDRLAVNYI